MKGRMRGEITALDKAVQHAVIAVTLTACWSAPASSPVHTVLGSRGTGFAAALAAAATAGSVGTMRGA